MADADARDVTRWWWIRHAPVPHLADQIYGDTDPDADVSETARLIALARRLPPRAACVLSHLRRTRQTADALERAGLSMPDVLVEPAFGEQNFGVLHGIRHVEHEATRTDAFRGLWPAPPDVIPRGGESFIEVIDRVGAAIERISTTHRGRDVICIAHSGPIRAAIAVALGLSPGHALALSIEPLSLTRLHRFHDAADGTPGWRLFGINECC